MLPMLKPHHRLKGAAIALALTVPSSFLLGAITLSNAETLPRLSSAADKPAAEAAPVPKPNPPQAAPVPPPSPIRSVSLVRPKIEVWPDQIEATGNIMPWQESHIGAEIGGLRLGSVLVNVGDTVKKGQVLAHLNAASVETDLDTAKAQLTEAEAALAQAGATLARANRLAPSGGVSQQDLTLYETQKHTAEARVNAAQAQVRRQQLRLEYATLVAPDDGVISSCSASEGAIVQAGSELFRLIRQGRLEWRAEVKGETLLRLSAGQEVTVKSPLGPEVKGHVRQLSPTIDITTRNGLVYVDLPPGANLRAGLNVTGTISMGKRKALVLPASAVLRYEQEVKVLKVNAENKIEAINVKTGRTKDGWVEIVAGLDEHTPVVARNGELLKIGELVKLPSSTPEAEN